MDIPVAAPGFDLTGALLCQGWGRMGVENNKKLNIQLTKNDGYSVDCFGDILIKNILERNREPSKNIVEI